MNGTKEIPDLACTFSRCHEMMSFQTESGASQNPPVWYHLLIKHVYSVHFPFSSPQFSVPHGDYAAVNIANGMNGVRNLWAFVLLDCSLLLGRVNDIWSHSSLFKLGCMLRRAPLSLPQCAQKIFLFISAVVSDYSWPFVTSSFLANNKLL